MSDGARLGALILTGGASVRMGADKAALDWAGRRAVDRVAELARGLGAQRVFSVGSGDYGLERLVEDPPGGGAAAGILAGARRLAKAGCDRIVALAVDAPTLEASDLAPLLAAPAPGAAFAGLHLPMVLHLAELPNDAAAGWPMARLVERLRLAVLPPAADAEARLRGANTPEERQALLKALEEAERARKPGGG